VENTILIRAQFKDHMKIIKNLFWTSNVIPAQAGIHLTGNKFLGDSDMRRNSVKQKIIKKGPEY